MPSNAFCDIHIIIITHFHDDMKNIAKKNSIIHILQQSTLLHEYFYRARYAIIILPTENASRQLENTV